MGKVKQNVSAIIRRLGACEDAVKWAKGFTSLKEAYESCKRGDHLLWLAYTIIGPTRETEAGKALWLARADCAATSLKYYERKYPGNSRVRDCIKGIRAYARGKIDENRLKELRTAAYAAATLADADAVADTVAYAAYFAAAAAAFAAADLSHSESLARSADIVRKHLLFKAIYAAYKAMK